jgi:hypothetical protein
VTHRYPIEEEFINGVNINSVNANVATFWDIHEADLVCGWGTERKWAGPSSSIAGRRVEIAHRAWVVHGRAGGRRGHK